MLDKDNWHEYFLGQPCKGCREIPNSKLKATYSKKCLECNEIQSVPVVRKNQLKFLGKLIQFFSNKHWFHDKICKSSSIILNSKHQICGNCLAIRHILPYQFHEGETK